MDPYDFLAKILPKKIRSHYEQQLKYSKIDVKPDKFIGFIFFSGIMLSIFSSILINAYLDVNVLPAFVISFVIFEFSTYIMLQFSIDSKSKFSEATLPDALQLMASNIRAGITTDKALFLAARPEFGPLAIEIKRIGKETMAGRNFTESLAKTKNHIRSRTLHRAVDLIINSVKSGGQLADLLDQTADNLVSQQMVEKEISADILMYVIFVFTAIGLGAPALFSMSGFLVNILTRNMMLISAGMPGGLEAMATTTAIPIMKSQVHLSSAFILKYSLISLTVSSFFGSLVMGLIYWGEEREGLKFFPILLTLSVGLFYIGSQILESAFGPMMGI